MITAACPLIREPTRQSLAHGPETTRWRFSDDDPTGGRVSRWTRCLRPPLSASGMAN